MKRYLVTGAGGHLGSALLRELVKTDCVVHALLQAGESEPFAHPRVRYFVGDVRDPDSLIPLFEYDRPIEITVFHLASIITIEEGLSDLVYQVNVGGTQNMIALSRRFGVQKFIYLSSVHSLVERTNYRPITETASYEPQKLRGGYAKTKALASQAVLSAAKSGFPGIILMPSGIIGPYDLGQNHIVQLVRQYLFSERFVCVRGGYNFVDVRDVAKACLLAEQYGKLGEGYIIKGHYCSIEALLRTAGGYAGKRPPIILPISLAKLAAPLIRSIAEASGSRPLYTSYSLDTLTGNSNFDGTKARRQLHYRPRKLESTIHDMVDYLLRHTQDH